MDGASSSTQAVTLTNNTQAALPITGFTITGSNTFTATTTCGTSLPVASACKYNVTFAPTTAGAASATLTVTDNQGTQSAALTGTGVAAPRFSPSSLSFGNVTIGTTATLTATLTNPGPAAYPIQALFSAGIFGLGGGTCAMNPTLVAGASCTLVVTFTPTKAGVAIDAIEYGATTTEPAVILNLTATGVAPAAPKPPTFSPSSLAFGDVTIGTTATMTATLTNPGPAAYPVQAFFSAGIFGIGGGTCTTNPTLAAGASCTLVVTFTPTKAGVVTDAIEYGATETEPPVMLNLTATGVPSDDFALTDLSGSTVSAAPGSAVHVLLGVTSTNTANPFTSLVTFTISGLPAGVTASFSSTTVMPGIAGATTSLTITLPASNARNKMPGSPISPREQETAYGISAAALLCGMLGMRKRLNVRLLISLCVLGLLGGIVGCGSGVSSSTSAPPSTANVTVTATSGAIAHSTVIQLTVQ